MRRFAKYLIALAMLGACSVVAAPLDEATANSAYRLAQSVSKLPFPNTPPEVHVKEHDFIEGLLVVIGVCPKGCPSVKAAQIEGRVFVDGGVDFSEIQNYAVLVHEDVHFLQWAKLGDAQNCEEWLRREKEAYSVHNLVLNKAGARMTQEPAWPDCSK